MVRTATCAQSFEQKRSSPWGVYFGDKLQQTSSSRKVTITCLWKIAIQTMLKHVLYIGVNTAETIPRMKKVFSTHGICDTHITDSDPHLHPQNLKSLQLFGGSSMLHRPHCAHNPMARSSGQYRPWRQNLTMIYLALLTNRDTPLPKGYSAAQLSMGRKQKNSSTLQSG